MEFHDYPQVAHEGMNQAHEEFVRLLNNAEQELLMGGEFCAHLDKLYKHCVAHFSQEEAEILANHCPNYRTHQQEHERVLQLIRDQMEYYEKTQHDEAALGGDLSFASAGLAGDGLAASFSATAVAVAAGGGPANHHLFFDAAHRLV